MHAINSIDQFISISVRPTLQFGLSNVKSNMKSNMYSHLTVEQQTKMEATLTDAERRSEIMNIVYQQRGQKVP